MLRMLVLWNPVFHSLESPVTYTPSRLLNVVIIIIIVLGA